MYYLLHEQDQNFSEDLNKVNEEVQRVGNEVLVSIASLPDDDLGVEHDEATEDTKTNPDVSLKTIIIILCSPFQNINKSLNCTWNRS